LIFLLSPYEAKSFFPLICVELRFIPFADLCLIFSFLAREWVQPLWSMSWKWKDLGWLDGAANRSERCMKICIHRKASKCGKECLIWTRWWILATWRENQTILQTKLLQKSQ
jgi:hypothetical protein